MYCHTYSCCGSPIIADIFINIFDVLREIWIRFYSFFFLKSVWDDVQSALLLRCWIHCYNNWWAAQFSSLYFVSLLLSHKRVDVCWLFSVNSIIVMIITFARVVTDNHFKTNPNHPIDKHNIFSILIYSFQ